MTTDTITRPWKVRLHGRVELTEEQIEQLGDLIAPYATLTYFGDERRELWINLLPKGSPWSEAGHVLFRLDEMNLPDLRRMEVEVMEGETEEEAKAWLDTVYPHLFGEGGN